MCLGTHPEGRVRKAESPYEENNEKKVHHTIRHRSRLGVRRSGLRRDARGATEAGARGGEEGTETGGEETIGQPEAAQAGAVGQ